MITFLFDPAYAFSLFITNDISTRFLATVCCFFDTNLAMCRRGGRIFKVIVEAAHSCVVMLAFILTMKEETLILYGVTSRVNGIYSVTGRF